MSEHAVQMTAVHPLSWPTMDLAILWKSFKGQIIEINMHTGETSLDAEATKSLRGPTGSECVWVCALSRI